MSEPEYPKKAKHRNIGYKYNSFVKIGNSKLEYIETFNNLSGLRIDARYLNRTFNLDMEKAKEFLETISKMINYTAKLIE